MSYLWFALRVSPYTISTFCRGYKIKIKKISESTMAENKEKLLATTKDKC